MFLFFHSFRILADNVCAFFLVNGLVYNIIKCPNQKSHNTGNRKLSEQGRDVLFSKSSAFVHFYGSLHLIIYAMRLHTTVHGDITKGQFGKYLTENKKGRIGLADPPNTGLWDKDMSLACFRRANWISCEYKINHAVCKVCRIVADHSKNF